MKQRSDSRHNEDDWRYNSKHKSIYEEFQNYFFNWEEQ